jgi:hypothetical protein
MTLADLPEETRDAFYAYTVSVDVIRNADRSEILQMFRRMNAFTLPLNAPEKRHSEFFGEFKGWVNTVLDQYGSMFVEWDIFTSRQVIRMADAEFVADVALALEEGIVSTSPTKLGGLYRKYDDDFPVRPTLNERLVETFEAILTDLSDLQGTYMTKPHIFHSLVCALLQNRFGLPGGAEATGVEPSGTYFRNREVALTSLARLATAHEEKDMSQFGDYVKAASEGGNRAAQRAVRIGWLCRALRGELA